MITKNDTLFLLTELQNKGLDVAQYINGLYTDNNVFIEALKFINEHRPLEVINFYNLLRKNYNKKKSTVYINIMKEITEPEEVLTTLSALLTQIILFSKKIENKTLFLDNIRAKEISQVLLNYFKTYDITKAVTLLTIIKADIKVLENISNN